MTRRQPLVSVHCLPVTGVTPHETAAAVGIEFTPGRLDAGWSPVVAFVRGRFSPEIKVIDLVGPSELVTSASGIGGPSFGWYLGRFDNGVLPAEPVVLQAIVPRPATPQEFTLTVRVDMSLVRRGILASRHRIEHHRVPEPWTFGVVVPAFDYMDTPHARLCLAADIEHYSRFSDPEALFAQQRLLDVLRWARTHAGVAESAVITQGSGDSQFAILPTGLDESRFVPLFLQGLAAAVKAVNRGLDDHARLRIRVALDRGPLAPGVNGWVGTSIIAVHRLLDSPPLRLSLKENRERDYAVMMSRTLFQDVISHGYENWPPTTFCEVVVDIPGKGFTGRAWLLTAW